MALLVPAAAGGDVRAGGGDLAAYLRARAADADGRVDIAVADYARALAAAPASTAIAEPAYREALAAGDDALATRAAAVLRASGQAPSDLPLLAISAAARRNDHQAADAAIATLAGTPLAVLMPSLRAWSAYAAGRNPFAPLAAVNATADPIAARFAGETRALLLIARGDTAAGLAMVEAVRTNGAPIDLRLAAAQLLFAADRPAEARALLTGDDPVLAGLREGAPAKASLGFGVSRLLARVAADLAAQQGPLPLSIALASAALRAEPGNDRARLLLADALSRDRAADRALAVLDGVDAKSPFAAAAAAARITVLASAGRTDDALALAKSRAERADASTGDWQRYADRLATAGRPADAAPWYRRIIDSDGMASDWAAWLQYGGALDQAGDWPGAERALEKALALAPAEPLALNYLGYARAERGEDLPGATRLLERANALRPLDGSIVDSLGWAYHLSGETRRALPLLERAAAGDPTNAEIGDHLGDAYWTLGRRYEARYAWRAAALTATTADAARIAAKLTDGLPPRR
ncbi:tetratricopeptide repeat protein [Sphingomonas sp. Tas61C01]|uniref:tetratricopeptide repeat protein n=1 Tax=Sphingomonas sp. Tas61C01 TaxID=3458297 RepID=UPI00403E63E7